MARRRHRSAPVLVMTRSSLCGRTLFYGKRNSKLVQIPRILQIVLNLPIILHRNSSSVQKFWRSDLIPRRIQALWCVCCFVLLSRGWGRLETRPPVDLGSFSELTTFTMSLAPPVSWDWPSFSHFRFSRHRINVGPDPYWKGSITGN